MAALVLVVAGAAAIFSWLRQEAQTAQALSDKADKTDVETNMADSVWDLGSAITSAMADVTAEAAAAVFTAVSELAPAEEQASTLAGVAVEERTQPSLEPSEEEDVSGRIFPTKLSGEQLVDELSKAVEA